MKGETEGGRKEDVLTREGLRAALCLVSISDAFLQ